MVRGLQYIYQSNDMRMRDVAEDFNLGKEVGLEFALELSMLNSLDGNEGAVILRVHQHSKPFVEIASRSFIAVFHGIGGAILRRAAGERAKRKESKFTG